MANRLQKFIYFFSAVSPILLMLAIVWLIEKSSWAAPVSVSWKIPIILIIIAVMSIIIFNFSFNYGKKHLQSINVIGNNYSNDDSWIIGYVITYLFPFAELKFEDYILPIVAVLIGILLIVFTFTDCVTPHPILYIRKYHFYTFDVEGAASGYHLISRNKIRSAKDVKRVSQIYEFLLLREE